jgi:hypothetical protein
MHEACERETSGRDGPRDTLQLCPYRPVSGEYQSDPGSEIFLQTAVRFPQFKNSLGFDQAASEKKIS